MKKILLIISVFFINLSIVSAASVNTISISADIDNEGHATVTEVWNVPEEINTRALTKRFYQAKGIKISNINIVDSLSNQYTSVDKWEKERDSIFYYKDDGFKKAIQFAATGHEETYTITYNVEGIISKFDDLYGINFYFFVGSSNLNVNSLNLKVKLPFAISEANTALYGNGNKINLYFEDGCINLNDSNLANNKIFLITSFNDLTFTKARTIKGTAKELSEHYSSKLVFIDEMKAMATSRSALVVIGIFVVIIISLIVRRIIKGVHGFDEYYGIETINKKSIPSINEVNYFDSIPCNFDLYKIAFLGGYFNVYKNRANLVGAFILKWIFEGNIKIIKDDSKKCLKLADGPFIDRPLDNDLYNMLVEASSYYQLDGARLNRYAHDHYMRYMTWFNMGFSECITDELNRGRITKVKKFRNVIKVMNEELIEEATHIQGLKRYLLNFNQVPRQSELTTETYQYLLIVAELLGVGEAFAREILRKNPDNSLAQTLLDLESLNYIYKGSYNSALSLYKQVAKNFKNNVDSGVTDIIQKQTEERHSKL